MRDNATAILADELQSSEHIRTHAAPAGDSTPLADHPSVEDPLAPILQGITAMFVETDIVEIRAPKAGKYKKDTISGYFRVGDGQLLAEALQKLSGTCDGVYVTLNPCKEALLARANNRLDYRANLTTADHDILKRVHLLVDIDPVRPAGISASDDEILKARDVTSAVFKHLRALGWATPLTAKSGNGYHLIYNIDLPNDKESADLMKAVLNALATKFDTDFAKIDTSVFNASRIVKAYGTLAAKGDSTDDRPYRVAEVTSMGNGLVTVEQLQAVAIEVSSPVPSGLIVGTKGSFTVEKIETFLEHHDVAHGPCVGNKWILTDGCPFNPDHIGTGDKIAAVFLSDDGIAGFHCFHASCANNGWKEFRKQIEETSGKEKFYFSGSGGAVTAAKSPAEGGQGKQIKKITVTRFSEVEEKPMEFFWKPYMPFGELVMFSGDPGDAKSWMSLLLGAMLTNGRTFSDFGTDVVPCEPGNVLLIAAEDSFTKTLKKRARELGANQNRLMHLSGLLEEPDGSKDEVTLTAEDVPLIEAAVVEHKAKLLIIDPLACFGGDLNLNQSSQMRKVTTPLRALAERHNIVVVVIRHNRKTDDGAQAIYKGSGSIDGTGAARSELAFIRLAQDPEPDNDGVVVSSQVQKFAAIHVKHNLTRKGAAIAYSIRDGHLQIDGLSDKTDKDVLGSNQKKEDTVLIDRWLKNLLKDGAVPAAEAEKQALALEFGETKRNSAKKRLGVLSKPIGFGKGWYWGYPEQLDALKEQAKAEANGEVTVSQVSQVPKLVTKFAPTTLPKLPAGAVRRRYATEAEFLKQFTGEDGKELEALMDKYSLVTRQSKAGGYAIDLMPLTIRQKGGKQ